MIRRSTLTLALTFGFLLTGCAGVMENLQNIMTTPTADLVGVRLAGLDLQGAELQFDVEITNPLGVPLPLLDLAYGLATQDTPFVSGRTDIGGTVPARGRRVVQLPVRVEFLPTLELVRGLRPGQVLPYRADLTMSVDPPVGEPLALPLSHQGELPIPTVPDVSVGSIEWSELSLTKISGALKLDIANTNEFPVDLRGLSYALALDGTDVARGTAPEALSLGAGEPGQLSIPLELSPLDLGVATFRMLSGSGAGYSLKGDLDVGTPFGDLDMPYDELGETVFRR